MATKPKACPECPTCLRTFPEKEVELRSFASSFHTALAADNVAFLYEDAQKGVGFLGALAEAAPRAIAHAMKEGDNDDEWVMWLAWLANELKDEAQRRLLRLQQAGLEWQRRAEALTDANRKEG